MDGIFGGFVLGRVVDEASLLAGYRPQALSVQFVAAVHAGEVEMTSEVLHRGRSTASIRIELHQQGRVRAHAIASLVAPTDEVTTWRRRLDPEPWGDPESMPTYIPAHAKLSYGDHLDIRRVLEASMERGAGTWVRMTHAPSHLGLLSPHGVASVFLDALPPGLFALEKRPVFVPTIDFAIHFAPGIDDLGEDWCYVTNHTVWTSEHFCVDESALYDRSGSVLAQVRQGRAVRWP
jgi:acyl-CoA thioesterase